MNQSLDQQPVAVLFDLDGTHVHKCRQGDRAQLLNAIEL